VVAEFELCVRRVGTPNAAVPRMIRRLAVDYSSFNHYYTPQFTENGEGFSDDTVSRNLSVSAMVLFAL
jgi:hypothetical protein